MPLVVVNEGEYEMLSRILNVSGLTLTDVVLRLYVNDVLPDETDTASTYTECTTAGYNSVTLEDGGPDGDWVLNTDGSGITSATFDQIDFVLTDGPVDVYGYYVTDGGGVLMWAERFDTTASLGSGGGTISVTPYIELD